MRNLRCMAEHKGHKTSGMSYTSSPTEKTRQGSNLSLRERPARKSNSKRTTYAHDPKAGEYEKIK